MAVGLVQISILICLLAAAYAQALPTAGNNRTATPAILRPESFKHFVDDFNANDQELYPSAIRNAEAWPFLEKNVPLFECSDQSIEEIYYFRWWTYRKHIKQTPDGFIITEFLPDVRWAGKYNSINCAAALHLYEGRWLREPHYLDDYATFWLRKGGSLRSYSFWIADALWNRFLVSGDARQVTELFTDLIANYDQWEKSHRDPNGLFWQIDDRDGMEMSAGGSGYRPSINSYMFADARAIANMADLRGKPDVAGEFRGKAERLKQLVQDRLWNPDQSFFETLPRKPDAWLVGVRELIGFTPWYVNLPDARFAVAWKQLMDPAGFFAPFGLTTVERRSPRFTLAYKGHECQWNGPSWPFATSITLTALANFLNSSSDPQMVTKSDYFRLLQIYAMSQHLKRDDGSVVPWIDEDLNPLTGDWIARTIQKPWAHGILERGKDYNHSTFCDLVITGLVGLRPRADDTVEVNPLLPQGTWDYFCLDQVPYHGHCLTILYDKTGDRYGKGKGLRVLADGKELASSEQLMRVTGTLPSCPAKESS